jgi:hypothetical protein
MGKFGEKNYVAMLKYTVLTKMKYGNGFSFLL